MTMTAVCMRNMAHMPVLCYSVCPNSPLQATGSFDETVRLWDVRSGRVLREVPAHSDPVTGVAFSPDGSMVASSSFDGLVRLWDTGNGHCLRTLTADKAANPATFVCFSPNGGCRPQLHV